MIASLIRDRYRPPMGSRLWAKYWAKRAVLGGSLVRTAWGMSRYHRKCQIGPRTVISPSDIAGRMELFSVGADCAIGRVQIQLHAPVTIGNCVVINDGCRLLTGTHNVQSPDWELIAKPIVVGDYAWIATGAIILPGITIGRGAVVGAGAVVSRSVEPETIVAGNPARAVGLRQNCEFRYQPSRKYALIEAWLGRDRAEDIPRNVTD
jgi:maltose O-acetyltransferase